MERDDSIIPPATTPPNRPIQLPHSTILFPVHRGIASADKGETSTLKLSPIRPKLWRTRARTFHPCLRSTWLILLSPLCATTLLLVSKRRVGIADAGAENRDGGGGWWVSSGRSTSQSSDYDDKSFLSP